MIDTVEAMVQFLLVAVPDADEVFPAGPEFDTGPVRARTITVQANDGTTNPNVPRIGQLYRLNFYGPDSTATTDLYMSLTRQGGELYDENGQRRPPRTILNRWWLYSMEAGAMTGPMPEPETNRPVTTCQMMAEWATREVA